MISLYFHFPYCISKCRYCDFCSVPLDGTEEAYPRALKTDMRLRSEQYPDESARTVFFGGGTPTVFSADALCSVLESAGRLFPISENAEISVECNPGTASFEKLHDLRAAGFNRLSIGLQSTSDRILKRIGRVHDYSDFLRTFEWARKAGFKNINVDVMNGLPGQTLDDYLDTLVKVCALGPEHVSAYSLILEEETPLWLDVNGGCESVPDQDETADMLDAGMDFLAAHDYRRYEISNYAKVGYECKHNLTYWDNGPYLSFGVAAHSSMQEDRKWYRFSNTESIPQYLSKMEKGKTAETERILINTFERMFESVMLGLRKTDGIRFEEFRERHGCDLRDIYPEAIEKTRKRGLLDEDDPECLRLNKRGLDLLNSVLLDFQDNNYWDLLRP